MSPGAPGRRNVFLVVGAAILLASGIGLGSLLGGKDDGAETPAAPGAESPEASAPSTLEPSNAPPPSRDEQVAFDTAINTDEDIILAEAARNAPVETGVAGAIQPGATVDVDWETFYQFEPGAAVVDASTPGPPSTRFTLLLLWEHGGWRLLAMEPQT